MKKYELLEHTADAKFRAYGIDMEDAFSSSVIALTEIATDPSKVENRIEKQVSVKAGNPEQLLYDFLDELIFLVDTEHFISSEVVSLSIEEQGKLLRLDARLRGDDVRRHGSNLKAVTYNEMLVKKQEDGTWVVEAVIDI